MRVQITWTIGLLVGVLILMMPEAKADPIHEAAEEGDVDRVS
ncbi:MAG: hypothetical protein V3V34_00435 [Kiloniellales bacterium]